MKYVSTFNNFEIEKVIRKIFSLKDKLKLHKYKDLFTFHAILKLYAGTKT